jgi:DNA-binding HxlR family transcriptional regulator
MPNAANKVGCPVEDTLRVIAGRWKVVVLYYLFEGPQRFNELQRKLGGITQRTLTKQLRELESDGIVHREVFAEVPPRVEYSLTSLGKTLKPVLAAMHDWSNKHARKLPKE